MPRAARMRSETNIYHIMLRGINHQTIFEDDNDYYKFITLLSTSKKELGFEIFAYCLMNNHVHLVLRAPLSELEIIFKKVTGPFASFYNYKYERCGHLFQDRYKSEAINSESQLFQTIKYVHFNPVKAGLCGDPADYRFSSYSEYLYFENSSLCDLDLIFGMIDYDEFINLHKAASDYACMDLDTQRFFLNDDQAKRVIEQEFQNTDRSYFNSLNKADRDKCIRRLRELKLTIKQISRLTGIGISVVKKASAQKETPA